MNSSRPAARAEPEVGSAGVASSEGPAVVSLWIPGVSTGWTGVLSLGSGTSQRLGRSNWADSAASSNGVAK